MECAKYFLWKYWELMVACIGVFAYTLSLEPHKGLSLDSAICDTRQNRAWLSGGSHQYFLDEEQVPQKLRKADSRTGARA